MQLNQLTFEKASLLQMMGLLTGAAVAAAVWECVCVCLAQQPHSLTVDFTSHAPPAKAVTTQFLSSSLALILGWKAVAVSPFQHFWMLEIHIHPPTKCKFMTLRMGGKVWLHKWK